MKTLIGVMEAGGGKDVSLHVSVTIDFNGSDKAENESPVCMMHDDPTESRCQFFRLTVYEVCEFLLLLLLNCCCRTPLAGRSSLRSEISIGGGLPCLCSFFFFSQREADVLSFFDFSVLGWNRNSSHYAICEYYCTDGPFFYTQHLLQSLWILNWVSQKRDRMRFIRKVMWHLRTLQLISGQRWSCVY